MQVRNLGAPVELAQRYFAEGADEVTFLNITGFRDFPLSDLPMLEARPLMCILRLQPHLFAAHGRQRHQLLHEYVGLVKGSQGDMEIMSKVGVACTIVGSACTSSCFYVEP